MCQVCRNPGAGSKDGALGRYKVKKSSKMVPKIIIEVDNLLNKRDVRWWRRLAHLDRRVLFYFMLPRAQINTIDTITVFKTNSEFKKFLLIIDTVISLINRIFIYSAMKISANIELLYSILNPDTIQQSIQQSIQAYFGAWPYPLFNNNKKSVPVPRRHRHQESSPRATFETTENPTTLHPTTPIVFTFSQFCLINFDHLIIPTQNLGPLLQPINTHLPTKRTPVDDAFLTNAQFPSYHNSSRMRQD